MKIAILDDYQNIALTAADWGSLAKDAEIVSFTDHLSDEDQVAARLKDFEIICAMRERTPFTGSLMAKLPNLKLLVSSGMRNRGIDTAAAKEQGVVVCGTKSVGRSQNLTQERCDELGVEKVSKEELMKRSDFITIHLILSDRSRGVIGAEELALMKSTAYIVNTARGPIIDEDALVAALENKAIAGAGVDVFSVEPLPVDHAFRRLENAIITPHLGYVSDANYVAYFGGYVEAIEAFLAGEPKNFLGGY